MKTEAGNVYTAEITGVPENYRVKEHQADADVSSFTLDQRQGHPGDSRLV